MWRVGWECSKGPKHLWLDPGSTGEEVAVAGFQAGGSSEGWVVDASVYPRIFFRPEAVGRGWLHGGQAQDWLQNNLQGKEETESSYGLALAITTHVLEVYREQG